MQQLMQPYLLSVYPRELFLFANCNYIISLLVLTYLLVLADVAGKLGYDEIDDVTTEDMALEVRMVAMQTFFENQMKSKGQTNPWILFLCVNSGSQGGREIDQSKEDDGSSSKTFLTFPIS